MSGLLTPEAIALLGIFLGLAAKSFLPYIRKTIVENQSLQWQHRFSAILIVCAVMAIVLFPEFSPPADGLRVFVAAFSFGIGVNWTATEAYQWVASVTRKERKEK